MDNCPEKWTRKMANILRKLEGLQTAETVAETLNISRQSAINLVSKLKKQGHVTVSGGRHQKRIYKITMRKQRKRENGMFDIINKYSPMKVAPWYDHQVHGRYGPEEALIDAVETQSFRAILASTRLFNHITDWPKLYRLAKEKGIWQKVGALYDTTRLFCKTRKMPKKYKKAHFRKHFHLIKDYPTKEEFLLPIKNQWKVDIPFRRGDLTKVIS